MNKNVTVRTISQLPEAIKGELNDDALLEVSVKNSRETYNSKRFNLKMLKNITEDTIARYNAKPETYNLNLKTNVGDAVANLDNLLNGDDDKQIKGTVHFNHHPQISNPSDTLNGNSILNKSETESLINEANDIFINQNSVIVQNVVQDKNNRNIQVNDPTVAEANMSIFQIGNGVKGHLCLYGWVSDMGNVSPAQAWISMQCQIKDSKDAPMWKDIQIQPWIIGEKHKQLQYVSFCIPVAGLLDIRIKTGFLINYSNSGFQNVESTLTNAQQNIFKGYVIGKAR